MNDQSYVEPLRRGAAHTTAEINQQPEVWRQVGHRIDPSVRDLSASMLAEPTARVVLTGAGTSAFAGEVLAPGLRTAMGRRVEAIATTDLVATPRAYLTEDLPTLLVSFARSGDSPESVAAVDLADELLGDVRHLVLTCNAEGRLAQRFAGREDARVLLMPERANDQGFAMTSSFTGMMLAALLTLDPSAPPELSGYLATIAEQVLPQWDERSRELAVRGYRRMVYLGSGALKGLAHESALKVMELTAGRVVAMGDSPLGFRHGPKSVLDETTLVVVYLSNDAHTRAYDLDLLQELRQSQGDENVLAISADRDDVVGDPWWQLPDAADLSDAALAVPAVLCAQLLALHSSLALGLTADNPFPSGEVNRVVQGVRIHSLHSGGD